MAINERTPFGDVRVERGAFTVTADASQVTAWATAAGVDPTTVAGVGEWRVRVAPGSDVHRLSAGVSEISDESLRAWVTAVAGTAAGTDRD